MPIRTLVKVILMYQSMVTSVCLILLLVQQQQVNRTLNPSCRVMALKILFSWEMTKLKYLIFLSNLFLKSSRVIVNVA